MKQKQGSVDLIDFMKKCGLIDWRDGMAVWKILANRTIMIGNEELENNTWRMNGQRLSEHFGGDYMDYYMNDVSKNTVKKVWRIMKKHGATDKTVDEGFITYEIE